MKKVVIGMIVTLLLATAVDSWGEGKSSKKKGYEPMQVTLMFPDGWPVKINGEVSAISNRGVYYNLLGHHTYDQGGLGHIVGMIRTSPGVAWALMSFTYNPLRERRCIPTCQSPYVFGGWIDNDPVEGWIGEYTMFQGGDVVGEGSWQLLGFSNE